MEQLDIKKKKTISPVWILPLVTLAIAGWLGFKAIQERGIDITVRVKEATGLTPGKTQVLYKGLSVGLLKKLAITSDLQSVDAEIEMVKEAADKLTAETKFWVVKPELSASKISGLETIVSGNYFEILPGSTGEKRNIFQAEDEPPPRHANSPGLHLTLISTKNSSHSPESPVLYKKIKVGEIISVKLDTNDLINTRILIYPKYSHLVSSDSKFWDISSVEFKANLPNISVKFGTLKSILAGGVSFMSPEGEQKSVLKKSTFTLYSSLGEALQDNSGLQLILESPQLGSLGSGKPVYFRQMKVGHITEIELSEDSRKILIHINIHEPYKKLIHEKTKFWNSSGIRIQGGLMTSMKISTESLASLLDGGISFITPEKEMGNKVQNGSLFTLHREPEEDWLSWSPEIKLHEDDQPMLKLLEKK